MIPCYKKHDTSFIWYYYTYHISKAILDLDPDLCQNFCYFVTLSILHIETCMIPLSKAVHKGFISFFSPKSFEQFMGTLWPQNWKTQTVLLITEPYLHIESCVMLPLKASSRSLFLFLTLASLEQYMGTLWPKNMKIWWFNGAFSSLIHHICSKWLVFETTN